jgi:hypothetical protein
MFRRHGGPGKRKNSRTFRRLPIFLACCFPALLAGCGESAAPALAPVAGKVFYHGRPVARGLIVFVPDESLGGDGPLSKATIGPDGSYVLRTGDGVGAAPGAHRVTVAAVETAAGGEPRSLLPDKYRDPDRSGLRCEITAGRANTLNFHLE